MIDLAFSLAELPLMDLTGKKAIVIDVFRFTTTVLTAFMQGARSVIPVATVKEAELLFQADPTTILCGERDGEKIPGFSLGNSSLEYTKEVVSGKDLIFTTTNGTQAIVAARQAEEILMASLGNLESTADYLKKTDRDLVFVPAGLYGRFSLEDVWCAGALLERLEAPLSDAARAAVVMKRGINLSAVARGTHGQNLLRLGFEKDVEIALELDRSDLVLSMQEKRIRRL